MDLNEAIEEAYAYADPSDTIYETLEISHTFFLVNIFLVNSFDSLTTNQGIFKPVNIEFSLPETESSVRGQMKITIEFLPKEYQDKIYAASKERDPVKIQYRQYLAAGTDPDAELPVELSVTSVEYSIDDYKMVMIALYPDLVNIPFCRRIMTTTVLPGGRV